MPESPGVNEEDADFPTNDCVLCFSIMMAEMADSECARRCVCKVNDFVSVLWLDILDSLGPGLGGGDVGQLVLRLKACFVDSVGDRDALSKVRDVPFPTRSAANQRKFY